MINIREFIKNNKIFMDGAMGTYYAQIKDNGNSLCELANIDSPELIKEIHSEYIAAGANLIRTNTFSVGMETLGITEAKQKEIIVSACEIAQKAAENKAYITGDIGPLHELNSGTESEILDEYKKICDVFIDRKLDAILFETFSDAYYIKELAHYIRQKSDIFIITNFCINKNGFTNSGISGAKIIKEISDIDEIDACGFNCGIGSGHMNLLMKKMPVPQNKYFACIPNAGYPEEIHNRMVFVDNIKYFSENMVEINKKGVDIIGGCCGTTPEYIRELVLKIDNTKHEKKNVIVHGEIKKNKIIVENEFYNKCLSDKKVIAVEIDPPYDACYERIIELAHTLKEQNIDIITMADSPMGRSRVDSILMSLKLQQETGINVMPHISCRDKNMIAMRSTILGAYINGIRNLMLVTGDPVPNVNRISTTGVFDYNSIQLMNFVKEMNNEHFSDDPFYYGGALNVTLGNIEKIIERMKRKIDGGAKYFMTQPIFSQEAIERVELIKSKIDTKILCGIMPLVSYRNANFIKNEFIGIEVPDNVISRYSQDMTKEEGENAGAQLARELIEKLNPIADGYYFMLPFNRVSLIEKIKTSYEK